MYFKKLLLVLTILSVSYQLSAETYLEPIHSSEEVLAALYSQAQIDPLKVKVVLLRFDYTTQFWQIELTDIDKPCIDCYPSYGFKNEKKLRLGSIPHG